jgi:hypothetical protein
VVLHALLIADVIPEEATHCPRRGRATVRLAGQGATDEVIELAAHVMGDEADAWGVLADDPLEERRHVGSGEGHLAGEALEEDDADAPDVCSRVDVWVARRLLG